jgi:hypothetical protein
LLSLTTLFLSYQESQAIITKSPEPLHIKEVIKEINSFGFARLCQQGTVGSKSDSNDFRYRQKGNNNHDEYLMAWILCGKKPDGSINSDFRNSTFGRTIQTNIGGKVLDKAKSQAINAVQNPEKLAHKLFCSLDKNKLSGHKDALEIIQHCSGTEKTPTVGSVKIPEDNLQGKRMHEETLALGEQDFAAKRMNRDGLKLGADDLAAKRLKVQTMGVEESNKTRSRAVARSGRPTNLPEYGTPPIKGALRDLQVESNTPNYEFDRQPSRPKSASPALKPADKTIHLGQPLMNEPQLNMDSPDRPTYLRNFDFKKEVQQPKRPRSLPPTPMQDRQALPELSDEEMYDANNLSLDELDEMYPEPNVEEYLNREGPTSAYYMADEILGPSQRQR